MSNGHEITMPQQTAMPWATTSAAKTRPAMRSRRLRFFGGSSVKRRLRDPAVQPCRPRQLPQDRGLVPAERLQTRRHVLRRELGRDGHVRRLVARFGLAEVAVELG